MKKNADKTSWEVIKITIFIIQLKHEAGKIKMEYSDSEVQKMGIKNSPVKLNRKLTERRLLLEHMPTCNCSDFSKFSKSNEKKGPSNHVLNIITARTLCTDEIKLALFLFDRYLLEDWPAIRLFKLSKEGEISQKSIHAKSPNSKEIVKYSIPKQSLLEELTSYNIELEKSEKLHQYLQKLHDLGLLTLTDVQIPLANPVAGNMSQFNDYAFVELNNGITTAKVHKRWGKPKKEKSEEKHFKDRTPAMNFANTAISISQKNKKLNNSKNSR